ncbi:hypothetical protein D3C73_1063260 [compost metagenome]
MKSFLEGAKYSSPFLNGLHCNELISSGLFTFLESKLTDPHSLTSKPRFLAYQALVSLGLSEKKKMPPMPVTLGVSGFSACFCCSSMCFVFLLNIAIELKYQKADNICLRWFILHQILFEVLKFWLLFIWF